MELNYARGPDGMYILARADMEKIARDTLEEVAPQNLETPKSFDVDLFLSDYLGLLVKERYIGVTGYEALGLTVMSDMVEIPSLDERFRPTVITETYGNILISPSLCGMKYLGRKRYTEVHEGAHWILHRPYFQKKERSSGSGTSRGFVACRSIEQYVPQNRRNTDWLEWQADALAAALLMPSEVFFEYARRLLRRAGAAREYLEGDNPQDRRIFYEVAPELSRRFSVSIRATQIRMIHLGLIKTRAK